MLERVSVCHGELLVIEEWETGEIRNIDWEEQRSSTQKAKEADAALFSLGLQRDMHGRCILLVQDSDKVLFFG